MAKQPFRRMGVIHPIPPTGLTPPISEETLQEMERAERELLEMGQQGAEVAEEQPLAGESPIETQVSLPEAVQTINEPPSANTKGGESVENTESPTTEGMQNLVDVNLLYPGRFQPRFSISQEGIDDLASDIDRIGKLLNPVSVRPDGAGRYEIIAGERRWRACTLLGWQKIPVTFIGSDEKTAIMASLSENIQRQDLSEMEIGFYLKRMLEEGIAPTKRELSVKVGIDRRSLYKYLAFTDLPPSLQMIVRQGPTLFAASAAETMVDLCHNGYADRVHQAAHMILQGKLNTNTMRAWVTGQDRSRDPDRRPIVRDGVRVGTVSFGKDEMRIRLSPGIQDIPQEELAAMISAAILSRSEGEVLTPLTQKPADTQDSTAKEAENARP
ncbi:ParB/RepB/Spo0J family partition protein [Acidithiobacillus thiooxidans]|uniref:ParB/RepB/Spo0J family partition protein n=1 Tax=Acidithiobacillus thiooxidans TaxID=930 RepID=UPI001C067D3F|nr:ParB/RepB/Spo0J family partition protein [Acidithiobacillus thiooxidans]MBU2792780.1 ParB/RepB/Spo0J family partition protein [Acidithiobacillus thiooxidans]